MSDSPPVPARSDNSWGSSGSGDGGREECGAAWLRMAIKLSHRHPSLGSIPAPVVGKQRRLSLHLVNPLSLGSHSDPLGALGKKRPALAAPSPLCLAAKRGGEAGEGATCLSLIDFGEKGRQPLHRQIK